jgi:hypothetical protein
VGEEKRKEGKVRKWTKMTRGKKIYAEEENEQS